MKDKINIELLIAKFLNNEASKKELLILETELKKAKNLKIFKTFVKVNYFGNTLMENFDVEKAKLTLKKKIKNDKKRKRVTLLNRTIAVASVMVFAFFIFRNSDSSNKKNTAIKTEKTIKPGTNKAILTLENGQDIVLEDNKEFNFKNSNVNGKKIVYNTQKATQNEEIVYNYLTIPRGGQYFLTLSDGTKVWLNSESKIKYPVKFTHNALREVTLVYGEAYFDVSPSTKHKGTKFKVTTKNQSLIVYGTEFNIKAYDKSNSIYTTLVEGSITISNGKSTKTLIPDTQSIIEGDKITINKEVDVIYETAWKNGVFMFRKEKLEDMLKSLSRWYNIEVEYENESLKKEVFSGLLKRTDNIEELLMLLEKTQTVKFTTNKDKIIVKQNNY